MARPQPGIFAQGTRSHYHLEFDLRADATDEGTVLHGVVGTDGRRLAKRHGDTRLQTYRQAGVKPQRILALLAKWYGMRDCGMMEIRQLLTEFRIDRLPREQIIFTEHDDAWLRNPENNSSAE